MSESGGEVYRLLKSPIRREIISLLYTRGEMNATQLKLLLDISYGTLYYHLDFLKPLITQVGRGRYRLNYRGVRVAERMLEEMSRHDEGPEEWRKAGMLSILTLTFLTERATASPPIYLAVGVAAAGFYLASVFLMPVKPVLLHLSFAGEGVNLILPVLSLGLTMAYFLIVGGFLSRRRGGFGGLAASVLLSYIPVDIYLAILMAVTHLGMVAGELIPLFQAGFIVAHVVQLIMLAGALTYSRGIGWERSLPAALLLSYLSLLASLYNLF